MRGCGMLLSSAAVIFGMAGCAWAFFVGSIYGGETVNATLGWSFWLGWGCGIPLFAVGMVLSIIQRIIRAAGSTAERIVGNRAGASDFLPDLGFIDDFLGRR